LSAIVGFSVLRVPAGVKRPSDRQMLARTSNSQRT
jgi:hypothetical protein